MKILMVTPSYKSRSRPLMKTRSLERTPPQKKIGFAPLDVLIIFEFGWLGINTCRIQNYLYIRVDLVLEFRLEKTW